MLIVNCLKKIRLEKRLLGEKYEIEVLESEMRERMFMRYNDFKKDDQLDKRILKIIDNLIDSSRSLTIILK
jgi:predicted Holliday junction resolvase-like endonuclease